QSAPLSTAAFRAGRLPAGQTSSTFALIAPRPPFKLDVATQSRPTAGAILDTGQACGGGPAGNPQVANGPGTRAASSCRREVALPSSAKPSGSPAAFSNRAQTDSSS